MKSSVCGGWTESDSKVWTSCAYPLISFISLRLIHIFHFHAKYNNNKWSMYHCYCSLSSICVEAFQYGIPDNGKTHCEVPRSVTLISHKTITWLWATIFYLVFSAIVQLYVWELSRFSWLSPQIFGFIRHLKVWFTSRVPALHTRDKDHRIDRRTCYYVRSLLSRWHPSW